MNDVLKTAIAEFIQTYRNFAPPDIYRAIRDETDALSAMETPHEAASGPAEIHRLKPIFQTLEGSTGEKKPSSRQFFYPLEIASPTSIFPKEAAAETQEEIQKQYQHLLSKLKNRPHKLKSDAPLPLWFENFDSLMMRCTSSIPDGPDSDVSVYDRARINAAFAAADALYDKRENQQKDEKQYLLISGGISGIQGFIFKGYGDSRKYRSKLLRGRSFAISLMSELAADMLCREIGLPHISVILNAAGRFTVLAPNAPSILEITERIRKQIDKWLLKYTYGETILTLSWTSASPEDFEGENFRRLWQKMEQHKEEKKFKKIDLSRHGGKIPGYIDSFPENLKTVDGDPAPALCPICGKRPSEIQLKKSVSCEMCEDHIQLGQSLVKNNPRLAVIDAHEAPLNNEMLNIPIFDTYQILFADDDDLKNLNIPPEAIFKYWDLSSTPKDDIAVKTINGYVPRCTGEDVAKYKEKLESMGWEEADQIKEGSLMTLNLIALKAKNDKEAKDEKGETRETGTAALGVLKADVDDLGLIMGCGLTGGRFTLPRLSTLSRQMNNFFALYLPHLLEKEAAEEFTAGHFRDVYTVFAGGDDLFLIGPWNRIIELSVIIRKKFAEYVCYNPDIHFSGGISFHKPHTPVDFMADAAEHELEKSKEPAGKNCLTLFGETVEWQQMGAEDAGSKEKKVDSLGAICKTLENWIAPENAYINTAMLMRLNEFMKMADQENQLAKNEQQEFKDMACAKWRSRLAYTTARNAAKNAPKEEREKILDEVITNLYQWIDTYRGKLKIPVWQILYNRR